MAIQVELTYVRTLSFVGREQAENGTAIARTRRPKHEAEQDVNDNSKQRGSRVS